MIEHFPAFLLIGAAFLNNKPEESTAWKPSKRDVEDLRKGMEGFKKATVNGVNHYPYELYLASKGIISFDEHERWQVIDSLGYTKANETRSLMEWIDSQDQEKMFVAFPEEREIYDTKIAALMAGIKQFLNDKKLTN